MKRKIKIKRDRGKPCETLDFDELKKFTGKFILFKSCHCSELDGRKTHWGEVVKTDFKYSVVETYQPSKLWSGWTIHLIAIQIKRDSVRVVPLEQEIIARIKLEEIKKNPILQGLSWKGKENQITQPDRDAKKLWDHLIAETSENFEKERK